MKVGDLATTVVRDPVRVNGSGELLHCLSLVLSVVIARFVPPRRWKEVHDEADSKDKD
ncbi:MAG: hypothetical protein WCY01_13855 [Alkalispirochaeta sp.]